MFSVGASPYNGEIEQLMGGRARRRRRRSTSWTAAVRRGSVRRDAKGRFLPRGAGLIGGSSKRRKRRYTPSISSPFTTTPSFAMGPIDMGGMDDPLRLIRPSSSGYAGMSQGQVDAVASRLNSLKRAWNYWKDFTDSDDDVLPQMYPIAKAIVQSFNYLKRASKYLDYIPTMGLPRFSRKDQEKINRLMGVNRVMKHAGGPEFDRLVARELAKGNNPAATRPEIRRNLRAAMKAARGKLAGLDDPLSYEQDLDPDYKWDDEIDFYGKDEDAPPLPDQPAPQVPNGGFI